MPTYPKETEEEKAEFDRLAAEIEAMGEEPEGNS
jgi:hypothetical protein